MRLLNYTLLLLLLSFSLLSKDPYPKNPNIDILNYSFELHLNDSNDVIYGEANIKLKVKPGEKQIRLDLISKTKENKGMSVHEILFNNKKVSFSHEKNVLKINTDGLEYNINDILTVKYSGIPITGLIIGDNMHGDRTFFSDNWPNKARNWLPLVDHPYDKATSDFIIIAPNHYQVISNGLLVEETNLDNNLKKTH